MNDHLTNKILLGFAGRSLSGPEILAASDHIADCSECRRKLAEVSPSALNNVNLTNLFEIDPGGQHLDFDQMSNYVEGRLDDIAVEIAELHSRDCGQCRETIEGLREVYEQAQISTPQPVVTIGERFRAIFASSALRYAFPAILLIGAGFAIYFVTRDRAVVERPEIAVANVPPISNVAITERDRLGAEIPNNTNANTVPTETAALTLLDGSGELKLNAAGKIIGPFAGEYDSQIESAIRTGKLAIADEALRLKSASGSLMGQDSDASRLKVRSPIGKVISTAIPEFQWSSVDGVESYTVEVFDSNYNKVATSPPLKDGRWRVNTPLPAGREYTWQVTAVKDGTTLRAPARPAPDARFYVISKEKRSEIERARSHYGKSNLVLGIVYADAGLLDEAEREFQSFLKKNPGSNEALRLLNRVKAAR